MPTKTTSDKLRINLYMPQKLHHAATVLAERRGSSLSQIIRDALLAYVKTELPKVRDDA